MLRVCTFGAAAVCALGFAAGASAERLGGSPGAGASSWLVELVESAQESERGRGGLVVLGEGAAALRGPGAVHVVETSGQGDLAGTLGGLAGSPSWDGRPLVDGGFEGLGGGSPKHGEVLVPPTVPLPTPGLLTGACLAGLVGVDRRRRS